MKKLFFTALLFCAALTLGAANIQVDPAQAQIVVPENSLGIVKFAAKELQRHLAMVTGKEIPISAKAAPGKYTFLFGTPEGAKLQSEEAVWEISHKETRIYGDNDVTYKKIYLKAILDHRNKTGVLSAVYAFLEEQLGFLFLAPGDMDTFYTPAKVLKLTTGKFSWAPGRMVQRRFRYDYGYFASVNAKNMKSYPKFYQENYKSYQEKSDCETKLWLKKQRQGKSISYGYGHAFTQWWQKYGKTNPEYFAMVKGERKPQEAPDRIKMCVSNPALVKKIVDLWKAKKPRPNHINVCENDSEGFCECPNCRKLDIAPAGAKNWDENLSDRYIHFANSVAKEAKKIDPNVKITFYAYGVYRFPPKKFRVDPAVIIGFVPSMMEIGKVQSLYEGWRKMGATMMFQRPNDMHLNTGLPLGIEKRMFDHFQIGYKNGIIGTDYDSLHRFWDVTGVADYILARAHIYPDRTFDEHFKEYCSAFGAAAPQVKKFFEYWRHEIFEKRLLVNEKAIREKGRYGNFRRGLMWDMGKYYFEKDFDITDAMLKEGLKQKLAPREKALLEKLLRANNHSRVTLRAMNAAPAEKLTRGKELIKCRIDNWNKINMNFYSLAAIESDFGDVTSVKLATMLSDYDEGVPARLHWYFTPDPKDELSKKEIWKQPFKQIYSWLPVRVDYPWENQRSKDPKYTPEIRAMLKNYDGIGWYAVPLTVPKEWKGREVALVFGAVDESAWVYVNGQFCGSRIFKERDDWKTAFSIDITKAVNFSKPGQTLFVKVEDRGGQGGIWRPVMLVSKTPKKK